jgi:hypothetical protein
MLMDVCREGKSMTRLLLSVAVALAMATVALVVARPAQAQGLTRTFVSAAGNDSSACTATAPCRTFAGAYANTAPSGIIAALDPAGYGPLTITGAVTIDGNGFASITAPSGIDGAGITVNAGSSDTVILRGLAIDGANAPNTTGIMFNSGGALTIDGCVVRNMNGTGVQFVSILGPPETLAVSDSHFVDTLGIAILIETGGAGGAITAAIDRTALTGNSQGVSIVTSPGGGTVTVAVTDSVAVNATTAFSVSSSGPAANLTLTRAQIVGNAFGLIVSGANATLWLAQSIIAQNASGYMASSSGVIDTFGNNYFINNGPNTGSLTPVGVQ